MQRRNKKLQPSGPPLIFFVDQNVRGAAVEGTLAAHKLPRETVVKMPIDTPDEDWLREAGQAGWVCFSRDFRILCNRNETQALIDYKVAMFTMNEASGKEYAIVRRAAYTLKRAFVARIESHADLTVVLEGGKRLPRSRRIVRNKHERTGAE